MSASIRLFDPQRDSYEDLTRLLNVAYADLAAGGFNYIAATQSAETTRKRVEKSTASWVARSGDRIAGFISYYDCAFFRGEPEWYQRPHHSIFAQFAVDVTLRGTGLGSALLRVAEERALADRKTELACDTAENAHHLVAYYQRHGFRIVGRHRYRHATYTSLVFSKRLGVEIRTATDADFEAILTLARTAPWKKEDYLRVQLQHGYIEVAYKKDAVVAFIVWNREFFAKACVWLVVVDPSQRHAGVGSLLFAHVERRCKGERLYSSTNRSNTGMQRLFERRGYRYAGEIELDPGDPEAFYFVDL